MSDREQAIPIPEDLRQDYEHYRKYMKSASRADTLIERIGRAEQRVLQLERALREIDKEWHHFSPRDCYATGPRTGNISDYLVCPGCAVQQTIDEALGEH